MRRGLPLIRLGLGMFVVSAVVWLVGRTRTLPPAPVARCEAYWSHGWNLKLTRRDGLELKVRPEEVGSTGHCLAPGALVEKRRWEGNYRVDGSMVDDDPPTNYGFPAMFVISAVLVGAGVAFELRRRATF